MKLVLVEDMDQVLAAALRRKPKPLASAPETAKEKDEGTETTTPRAKTPVFPPEHPPAVA